jgi:hypothetical protein
MDVVQPCESAQSGMGKRSEGDATRIREFFKRYEEGANSFDPALITAQFTDQFMGAGPEGVACGKNGEELRSAIAQRHALFRSIGFKHASILDVVDSTLDDHYVLARVQWWMEFEKVSGVEIAFSFATTYLLYDDGRDPRIAFWISHDHEQAAMRMAGLLPGTG